MSDRLAEAISENTRVTMELSGLLRASLPQWYGVSDLVRRYRMDKSQVHMVFERFEIKGEFASLHEVLTKLDPHVQGMRESQRARAAGS